MTPSPQVPRSILVVDDEPPIRALLARQLRVLGYTVVEAGSAQAALALAGEQSSPFDLVLSDIVMPGMNGTELCARLLERNPRQALILISAHAPSGEVGLRGEIGAVPLLRKPFTVAELAVVLDRVLGARAPARETPLAG
ncbi:MAG TPA: response regulator [Gemmatimonadales bacterium]|nr:response regulator [Gemmatimonadales bacterium]